MTRSIEDALAESLALTEAELAARVKRNARRRRQRKQDRAPLVTAYWRTKARTR